MNRIDITSDPITYKHGTFYAEASELSHGQGIRRFNQNLQLFNPKTGRSRLFTYQMTTFNGDELTGWEYAYIVNGRHEYRLVIYND